MDLKMVREYDDEEKKELLQEIKEKHGSLEELKQKVKRSGCNRPQRADEFKILEALKERATYKKKKITDSPLSLSVLTTKRIELLEYLSKNYIGSIQQLADELERDYKNVYDDLRGLEKGELVELKKEGRRKRPVIRYNRLVVDM